MSGQLWPIRPVAVPAESAVQRAYASTNLADAYAIRLPPDASQDPELLARHVMLLQPFWIDALMSVRDAAVAGFGLKTSAQLNKISAAGRDARIGIFKIYSRSPTEVILGEDDKHLDFRVSILRQVREEGSDPVPYLVLSTVVNCHNLLGRTYLRIIAPFHRLVVKSKLRCAARAGWPLAGPR